MLQPAGVVQLRSITSENPVRKSVDRKNVSGSWKFFKRSSLDGQNKQLGKSVRREDNFGLKLILVQW